MTGEQIAIIERMRAEGKSYGQIGIRIGMSPAAVSWYCLRYGIEGPKGRAKSTRQAGVEHDEGQSRRTPVHAKRRSADR